MKHLGTKTLETERLILRKAKFDDSPAMYRNWASDSEATKYLTWLPYKNLEKVQDFIRNQIERCQHKDYYNWFIELKSIKEVIGTIGFVDVFEEIDAFEIGYVIGRNWWGQGIVPEAFKEIIRFAFEEVGAKRIQGQHDVANPNSGKVMLKCGMSFEGILRQAGKNNQGIVDICQHAIIAKDYFSRKNKIM